MNQLLIGLMGALLATNQPQAVSNLIQQNAGLSVNLPEANDPADKELEQLMAGDDAAMAEVDKWIRDNNAFTAQGAGESKAELNARIMARLDIVRKNYQDFVRRHPDFAPGYLAYASFLNNIGDEDAAKVQNEKALQLDPKNPAAWNNLGNYYGEYGPITNAFIYFAKAIELDHTEPVYYQNLAVMVYLYRTDAKSFYHLDEQQVFDKSLALYRQAMRLDPDNFPLATEYAENYYAIRPLRTNDALAAWTNTLQIAHNDIEREGVYIHLARVKMLAGRYAEARTQLDAVTNGMYSDLKGIVEHAITERESEATHSAAGGISTTDSGFSTNRSTAPTNTLPP
ncbi:MAG TPA: tetratricopeptide repeat protein [Verrucomicrobiae bacterium]|nr:tetratricopeptide repeat protein [Verrucomicrobiae bacterium]